MAMWQTDLARYIYNLFISEITINSQYNLALAGEVWQERFDRYPTIGEIDIFLLKERTMNKSARNIFFSFAVAATTILVSVDSLYCWYGGLKFRERVGGGVFVISLLNVIYLAAISGLGTFAFLTREKTSNGQTTIRTAEGNTIIQPKRSLFSRFVSQIVVIIMTIVALKLAKYIHIGI
jgi:hypothetical protein